MAALDGGYGAAEDAEDCPLCLESLPPFWDTKRLRTCMFCGKSICVECHDKRDTYVDNEANNGSLGLEEDQQLEQLESHCPLCRTRYPVEGSVAADMLNEFEKGRLPLHMYCILGAHFIGGTQGVEVNVERGMEIFKLGAEKGDPNCQYMMGEYSLRGANGLPKSTAEAKRWLLAATEQGHAIAELNLAHMSVNEGNDVELLSYLRGAASKGLDIARYFLGLFHYKGKHGLQKSVEEGIRVLKSAAERGHVKSMAVLGLLLLQPDPQLPPPPPMNNPNFTKGVHWVRRAAETGDPDSASKLGGLEETVGGICFSCKKEAPPEETYLRCSRCRAAWYCSKDCQRRHWKASEEGHKQCCIKWE